MPLGNPQVSIVITCYNYASFVTSCLESVFAQTFSDYEIILVDDGSTDDSAQKIKPFLADTRLRYIKQQNGGQANAKNRGIQESVGRFIAFLDADDLWQPDKLKKQIPLFMDEKIGVVYSRQSFIGEHNDEVPSSRRRKTMLPRGGKVTSPLFMDNFVPFSSSVVRADCFQQFDGFDESIAMGIDWDLWLRLSTRYYFAFIDEPLLVYRVGHPGQMSKNALKRQECSDRIMEKFRTTYPSEVPPALLRNAMAFTYCNRGSYFRHEDIKLSIDYYLKAIKENPFWFDAYKGLLKSVVFKVIR